MTKNIYGMNHKQCIKFLQDIPENDLKIENLNVVYIGFLQFYPKLGLLIRLKYSIDTFYSVREYQKKQRERE